MLFATRASSYAKWGFFPQLSKPVCTQYIRSTFISYLTSYDTNRKYCHYYGIAHNASYYKNTLASKDMFLKKVFVLKHDYCMNVI